ncbi:hypothetical protein HPP92_013825 [Vanilla planifolia]|uniref:Saposin B-type domain-containing protein n=1 Tax=Vanilla planifolia TaxID=51239 RepID=A0A835QVL1_VANPL|nr:hypothetical protein HPP92_013825 [Vanilla planifolia]
MLQGDLADLQIDIVAAFDSFDHFGGMVQMKRGPEIVEALHEACFNIHSFKQQCMSLLDHYVPLFFLEVSKLQPKLLCQKIEVIRTLLKVCNQVESYSNQCKKFVLEYGPIILANTEKFFEKTDICSVLHVCKAHKEAHFEQQLLSAAA